MIHPDPSLPIDRVNNAQTAPTALERERVARQKAEEQNAALRAQLNSFSLPVFYFFQMAVAIGWVAFGFWVSTLMPSWHAPAWSHVIPVYVGILVALFAVLLQKPVIVLRLAGLWWFVPQFCRHILFIGDTGSGKTEGGINQVLYQVTKHVPNWGGLVLALKSDEHIFIRKALTHRHRESAFRLLEVRPDDAPPNWTPPLRYNLVSDRSLPWTTHAKAIVDTASALTEGFQSSFFKPNAVEAIARGLYLLDALGRPVNLRALRNLLTSDEALVSAINDFQDVASSRDNIQDLQLLDYFKREFTTPKGKDQSAGTSGTVGNYLAPFQHDEIAEVFCSEEPNNVELDDMDKGDVIVTNIPQRFQTERDYIHTMLVTLAFYRGYRRLEQPWWKRRKMNLNLIVADEYQDIVTAAEDGMAHHKAAAKLRAAKMVIIAATQSELSFDPRIGEAKRKVLMKQFRTRFYFRQPDEEDGRFAADFIGRKTVTKRSRTNDGMLDLGQRTTTHEEDEWRIKPHVLTNLKDFEAVVIHPARGRLFMPHFRRLRMPPIGPDGKAPSWHGLRGLLTRSKD